MTGVLLALAAVSAGGPIRVTVDDPDGSLARTGAPVCAAVEPWLAPPTGLLQVVELRDGAPIGEPTLAQLEADRVWWMMPPGEAGTRTFELRLVDGAAPGASGWRQGADPCLLREGDVPVLEYRDRIVEPGERLAAISEANRIYAVARSDYLHPLYGLHGEELTLDWPVDHPHHRGIYWAWPEVMFGAELGDLHALQRVFARARPLPEIQGGHVFGEIRAESRWLWEDRVPIVRELAVIRAWRRGPLGRYLDLTFAFWALADDVTIARRHTDAYGGLNIRLAKVEGQVITTHTDPADATPRIAWADLCGTFAGAAQPSGLGILQHAANPDYPGDWVQFPELNWLQPTFPASGTRYRLERNRPLVLRYRLWIREGGPADAALYADQWRAYHTGGRLPAVVEAEMKR